MSDRKILTVVVPAYNVSKYLDRCLSSMEVASILEKIEVIIVNDGSTDNTADIAAKYAAKYPETYYLYNKENGGHGSGINFGIAYATGKYFKILDGDDWLNTDELKQFVSLLEHQNADIIASDFLCIQDEVYKVLDKKYCTDLQTDYGYVRSLSAGEVTNVIKMHSLTIRTNILKQMGRHIDEHCFYVDCEYITYPIPLVETVYFHKAYIYMYRLGRDGQSVNINSMQRNRAQHMHVLNSLLQFYKETDKASIHAKKYIEKCIGQMVENQFQIYISMGLNRGIRQELMAWDKELKIQFPTIYSCTNKKSITWLRRTNYWILGIGALVYRMVKGI